MKKVNGLARKSDSVVAASIKMLLLRRRIIPRRIYAYKGKQITRTKIY